MKEMCSKGEDSSLPNLFSNIAPNWWIQVSKQSLNVHQDTINQVSVDSYDKSQGSKTQVD